GPRGGASRMGLCRRHRSGDRGNGGDAAGLFDRSLRGRRAGSALDAPDRTDPHVHTARHGRRAGQPPVGHAAWIGGRIVTESLKLGGAGPQDGPRIRRLNRVPVIVAILLVVIFLAVIFYGLSSRGLHFGGDPQIEPSSA